MNETKTQKRTPTNCKRSKGVTKKWISVHTNMNKVKKLGKMASRALLYLMLDIQTFFNQRYNQLFFFQQKQGSFEKFKQFSIDGDTNVTSVK